MSARTWKTKMLYHQTYAALLFVILTARTSNAKLTIEPPKQEIEEQIKNKDYFVVIFCDETVEDEDCQIHIEDIGDQFKTGIRGFPGIEAAVTADAELISTYGITEFPVAAFFRKGIPILYSADDMEDNELPSWMNQHRDIHALELTDGNFEHDTQASTGATTGDWMIMFYEPRCQDMLATWETIAISLAQTKVVARVNTAANPELKERFKDFKECPTFVMFSHGKMYEYRDDVQSTKPILDFARNGFQSVEGVPVPKPIEVSLFATLGAAAVSAIMGGSAFCRFCVLGGGLLVVLLVVMVMLNKRRKQRAKFD